MPEFAWISAAPCPPGRWDLRLLGWELRAHSVTATTSASPGVPALLDWREGSRCADWRDALARCQVAAVGVGTTRDRARLLAMGFGDALPATCGPYELAARLQRLEAQTRTIPLHRRAGPVLLDLFQRDGRVGGAWLWLHPREFALLWRLAATPGRRVTRQQLLEDVWRLRHDPQTNTLEVHVSRLRAKLAQSRLGWLVRTHPDGGYMIGQQTARGIQPLLDSPAPSAIGSR